MKPALAFGMLAGTYALGVLVSVVAAGRVLDTVRPSTTAETLAWTVGCGAWLAVAIWAWTRARAFAECERKVTGQPVSCQAQRNAATMAAALVWAAGLSLLVVLLALVTLLRLHDALVVTSCLGGPLATVWYWASTLAYVPAKRE